MAPHATIDEHYGPTDPYDDDNPVDSVPALSLHPEMSTVSSDQPHENEWYRNFQSSYKVTEQPLHTTRPLRIIIIGAGCAGLNIAFKAARQLSDVSFAIYEKNADVGGTWLENRYPGCTCDIPSHAYQWSFWRNPEWSSYYSSSEEIWAYMKRWAVEGGMERDVRFGHKVSQARWDEEEGVWEVEGTKEDGKRFTDRGQVLASCHGALNTWRYPDIPGLDIFQGKLMHSANWDADYDLTDRTVAVIGGGSSAVQIIPSIQPKVKKLIPYLRSPVWITAGFGAKYAAAGGENFKYSEKQKEAFKHDPTEMDRYGGDVEGELNKRFTLMHLHSTDQNTSREYVAASMRKKLGNDPCLTARLVPDFALGCRRMTPGSDYLQSLRRDNVEVITDSAVEFTADGIVDESGTETKVDVIICATGFDVTRPSYDIIGRCGRNLGEEWSDFPKGYLSIMADGFPNMFYWIGPNGPASHGSILPVIEWHTRYMFKVITHMQRTSIKCLEPKRAAIEDSYVHTHELLKRTAWSSTCSSWFKNGKKHGPVTAIWPGSRLHYFESLKEPRYEDFDVEYLGNRFAYMGNGYTYAELEAEGNAIWYFDVLRKELEVGKNAFSTLAS